MSEASLIDCDRFADTIGITPVFNHRGEVIPIGDPETNGKIYVVWPGGGRCTGLFYNWYVSGVRLYSDEV